MLQLDWGRIVSTFMMIGNKFLGWNKLYFTHADDPILCICVVHHRFKCPLNWLFLLSLTVQCISHIQMNMWYVYTVALFVLFSGFLDHKERINLLASISRWYVNMKTKWAENSIVDQYLHRMQQNKWYIHSKKNNKEKETVYYMMMRIWKYTRVIQAKKIYKYNKSAQT